MISQQVTYRTKSISMLAFIASTLLSDYPVTTASFHLVYVDTIVKGRKNTTCALLEIPSSLIIISLSIC